MTAPDDPRRSLPSVDRLLRSEDVQGLLREAPHNLVVAAVRESVAAARVSRAGPPADWGADIAERVARRSIPSLHRVLNATGVVLHTNLGRAPLARAALEAMIAVGAGYSTLEIDLSTGARGSRTDHCAALLATIVGAEAALVVNNAAGALVLALNAVAAGREVIISRGELIEIGGSFRIPDILGKSGARLKEVGTTNRTHLDDYAGAIGPDTGAILAVHRSNFDQRGFVATPAPAELASLAHDRGIPCLHDVGSGLLADLSTSGLGGEPRVQDAVAAGPDLVMFSGDKLLGGPQAGCLVGTTALIARARTNPLARALRADKLTLAGLEATLALYHDPDTARTEIPVLRMLSVTAGELSAAASELAAMLPEACRPGLVPGASAVGGGAFPGANLPTTLVTLDAGGLGPDGLATRLRLGRPPLIARVGDGRVLLDPRTLPRDTFPEVADALRVALEA